MAELTHAQINELRALRDMADKGFAAWTNENFQDLLDSFDATQALNAKQSERITEFEAEREKRINKWAGLVEMWEKRTKTAKKANVKLREALLIYGKHRSRCPMNIKNLKFVHKPCNCDWEKVKAALAKGDKKC